MAIKTLRVFQEFTSAGYVPMPVAGNIDYGVTIAGTFPGTTPTTFQTDDPDIDVTLTATTDYYVWIRSHGTDWNPMYTRNVRVYPDSPLVNNVVMGIIIANLSNTVPYTGATANVDLGTYGLKADYLQLNTSPTSIPTTEGTIAWNSSDGTANLRLKGGTINLQVGEDSVARVVNGTTSNLLRADYKVVKIIGAQGQRLQIGLALANNDANSKDTIGLVAENINNNQEGFIMTSGVLDEINTTGSLQGETWLDGDTLYLSGTTAGKITNIKPQAPTHTIILGFVAYAHTNHGKIYVKVDNGYEIDELHNVKITTVANKNILVYETATSLWKNRNIFGTQGYVPYYDDTLLMKNSPIFTDGTQVIIGDNEEFSVGNKLSVVGNIAVHKDYGYHSGLYQILFRQDATGEFRIGTNAANDYTTFYANGTERVRISPSGFLGVGLTNPTSILHVKGTTAYTNAIIDNNSASGGGYYSAYQNGAEKAIFGVSGAWLLDNSSNAALIAKGVGQGIQFYTNGSTSEKMGINSDGNVFVGQTPTYVAGATQLVVRGKTGAGFVGVNHYDMSIKGGMNTFNYVFQVGTSTFHSMAFLVEDIERGRVNSSGRLLWGTTTDNTTDLVQINGSLIATSLKKSGGTSSQFLMADGSVSSGNSGTVTSVALSAPTGFSVSGSPITTSGTLGLSFASGYSLPSDATQATWTAKQNALNGTGFVKIVGTTISYDNSSYYLASNPAGYTTNTGTVTSVAMSVPTGLSISGSPITTSGTLALSLTAGYSIPTTSSQGTWDTAYNRSLTSIGVSGTTTKTLTLTKQDGTTLTASWSDINTDAVTSVFGRTGAIVATSGDYTTAQVTESGNLYYLDSRARASISGGTGISYNSTTGVITNTITQYTDALARASISGGTGISYNSTSGVITNTITQYTDALARASLSFVAGSGAYNSTTGVITIPTNTSQLTNGAGYITGITSLMVTNALGYTPVTNARQLTINGTTYDLSADRSWTISGTIGGLTSGYVPKATSASTLGNSLIYDNGTNIHIGGSSAPSKLTVSGDIESMYTTSAPTVNYLKLGTYGDGSWGSYIGAFSNYASTLATDLRFGTTTGSTPTEKMRITSDGNILVGTTTDGGYKLTVAGVINTTNTTGYLLRDNDVAGYGIYKGASTRIGIAANGNEYLSVLSNGNVGINTSSPSEKLHISGGNAYISGVGNALYFDTDGQAKAITQYVTNLYEFHILNGRGNTSRFILGNGSISLGTSSSPLFYINTTSGNVLINTTTDSGYKLDVNGTGIVRGDALYVYDTGSIQLGRDTTYSTPYMALGFGGRSNGFNKIYGARDTTDGIFISSATGRGIYMVVNGGATNALVLASTGNATFSNAIIGNQGLSVSGYGAISNSANKFVVDFYNGNSRLYSMGTNATTKGGYEFHTNSSDGSLDVIALGIASTGVATFSSSVLINGALNVGTSGSLSINAGSAATPLLTQTTTYTEIYRRSGGVGIYLGGTGDPINYYDNTQHYFRSSGGGTTYATINSSGYVGIGSSSIPYLLSVGTSSGGTVAIRTNAQYGSNVSPLTTDLRFLGYLDYDRAMIRSWDASANTVSGLLAFWTNSSANTFAERMRITPDGNLLVGTTADGGDKLYVNGTLSIAKFNATASSGGYVTLQKQGTDQLYVGSSTAISGVGSNADIWATNGNGLSFYTNGSTSNFLKLSTTGAATFSSSVTAGGALITTGAVATNQTGGQFAYSGSSVSLLGAWGANTSTRGILSFYLSNSIGTIGNEYARLTDSLFSVIPAATFSSSVTATLFSAPEFYNNTGYPYNTLFGSGADATTTTIRAGSTSGYQTSIVLQGGNVGNSLLFSTASTERMRITSGGNVLIGTTTDSGYKLDVNGLGRFSGSLKLSAGGSLNVVPTSYGANGFISFRNTADSATRWNIYNYTIGGATYGSLNFSTNDGVDRLYLSETGAATFSSSVTANDLITAKVVDGSAQLKLERTNTSTGAMYLGADNVGFKVFDSSFNTRLTITSAGAGTFASSVTATSFFESSDFKLKRLIEHNPIIEGIEKLQSKLYEKNNKVELGYFAQDAQHYLPNAVTIGSDGFLNLSYREVHTAKIASLEQRVLELETQLNLR
jgi:hypothetical protein